MTHLLETINEFFILAGFANLTLKSLSLVILTPISFVYLFGRCLNLAKDRLSKNVIAVGSIFTITTLELLGRFIPKKIMTWLPITEDWLFLFGVGVIFYVVLWQRFYDRADSKLDKVIGIDHDTKVDENGFPIKKKRG